MANRIGCSVAGVGRISAHVAIAAMTRPATGSARDHRQTTSQHRGRRGAGRARVVLRRTRHQILDLDARLTHRLQSPFGIFLQTAAQKAAKTRRHGDGHRVPIGLLQHHRRQRDGEVVSLERASAGQHFKHDGTERPDIRTLVNDFPAGLFRRHVRRRPENDARLRRVDRERRRHRGAHARGSRRIECLRKPEVKHLHRAVWANFDVRGLEVAMDDALLVRGFKGFRDLFGDRQRFVEGKRSAREALREILPLNQLHHKRVDTVRFFNAVDRGDVGMIE
jgi:hypothetical protein